MNNKLPAFVKQPRFSEGIWAGVFAGTAVFLGVGTLSFEIPHGATDNLAASTHMKYWFFLGLENTINLHTHNADMYKAFLAELSANGLAWQIKTRMYISAFFGASAGLAAAWYVGKPRDSRIKKEGGKLIEGDDVYSYGKPRKGQRGINLLPNFFVSEDKIREHLMVIAGTGAGKSSAIMPLMLEAINRGDRVLIFDFKGITEKWPGRVYKDRGLKAKDSDTVIIAPWDHRSVKWAIALDINSTMSAQDFAARMIPESKEPVFSQGARSLFAGLMVYLIKTKPGKWGFDNLSALLTCTQDEMIEIMDKYYKQGLTAARQVPATYSGITLNLNSFTGIITDLADIWPGGGGFSIKDWASNPDHRVRTVIMKTSTQFTTLSSAINGTLLGVLCSMITGMPDVDPGDAPIWLWLDEFSTLGKVKGWEEMVVTGRSKDFRIIMNVQSKSQLVETWGQHIAQTWIDAIGIKLLGKNDGEGAEFASDIIGSASYSTPTYSNDSNGKQNVNWSAAQEEALFSKTRVQTELGAGKFVIHGIKGVELLVRFPNIFSKMPLLRKPDIPSALCFTPHKIVSQSPTEDKDKGTTDTPAADTEITQKVVIAESKPAVITKKVIEEKPIEVTTSDDFIDLAELTGQMIEASHQKSEVVSSVAEDIGSKVIGQMLGGEAAHVFEAAMHVIDTVEAVTPDQTQSTVSQQVSALDKIAMLKARKKMMVEQLEQSL